MGVVWDLPAKLETREMAEINQKTRQGLTLVMQTRLQRMQDKFQTMSHQIIGRIDDATTHIDDLEKNIADLMTQVRVEQWESENKTPAPQKSWRLLIYTEIWNIIFTSQEETKWLLQLTTMYRHIFNRVCIILITYCVVSL